MTSDAMLAQIEAAEEALRLAAPVSYDAYKRAKRALDELIEARNATLPMVTVYVVGNTYRHRAALRELGLRWDAGHHAWIGQVREGTELPGGCYAVTRSAAALASMDHADSAY